MRNAPLMRLGSPAPALPARAVDVPSHLQFCVDAGSLAATRFFEDQTAIGLHAHIAASTRHFMQSQAAEIVEHFGGYMPETSVQSVRRAFTAGYLGRIQQELRFMKQAAACPRTAQTH